MAKATVTRQWPDGSATCVEVEMDAEHPDALDEMVRRALDLDRGAVPDRVEDEADGE